MKKIALKMLQKNIIFIFILPSYFFFVNTLENDKCSKYKSLWFSYKYPYTENLSNLNSPKIFQNVCQTVSNCCDSAMETEMVAVSNVKLKNIAENHFDYLAKILTNMSSIVNGFLLKNVDSSRQQLNQMFLNTYSSNYKIHQSFFFEFYDKLKRYLEGKEDNLNKIMVNFFGDMAEKIVAMMAISKKDGDTIRCLTNNLMKLDPYQGADKAVIAAVMKSYPLTRMFVNGLRAANDVIVELINEKTTPSWECALLYTKTFYCSLCSGSKAKPCGALCKTMIGKCLGSFNAKEISKLSKAWVKFVVTLENISKKLMHPFNMPEVNKNLHVKISDAIMNVHNFFPSVREKVWVNCKNQISRKRRSTEWINQLPSNQAIDENQSSSIDVDLTKLIKTFSGKLTDMKIHMKKFKNIICSNEQTPIIGKNDQCWNGVTVSSGSSPEPKQKSNNQNLAIDAITKKSINKLNEISTTLNMLISGQNNDPRAFKIVFIPKPLKPVDKQRDENNPITEGSGEVNNVVPQKPVKIEPTQSNERVIEGSGDANLPGIMAEKITKPPKSIEKLPNVELPIVTIKPDLAVKKPTISDDEDIIDGPTETTKNEPSNVPLEGSGRITNNKPKLPILPIITTAKPVVVIETESLPKKDPLTIDKPSEGSGIEESPDDETNNKKPVVVYPQFPEIVSKTTAEPIAVTQSTSSPSVTSPHHIVQELPGDIPQEIWIPRVLDYDSYGRLVSITTKGAPTCVPINMIVTIIPPVSFTLLRWIIQSG